MIISHDVAKFMQIYGEKNLIKAKKLYQRKYHTIPKRQLINYSSIFISKEGLLIEMSEEN